LFSFGFKEGFSNHPFFFKHDESPKFIGHDYTTFGCVDASSKTIFVKAEYHQMAGKRPYSI